MKMKTIEPTAVNDVNKAASPVAGTTKTVLNTGLFVVENVIEHRKSEIADLKSIMRVLESLLAYEAAIKADPSVFDIDYNKIKVVANSVDQSAKVYELLREMNVDYIAVDTQLVAEAHARHFLMNDTHLPMTLSCQCNGVLVVTRSMFDYMKNSDENAILGLRVIKAVQFLMDQVPKTSNQMAALLAGCGIDLSGMETDDGKILLPTVMTTDNLLVMEKVNTEMCQAMLHSGYFDRLISVLKSTYSDSMKSLNADVGSDAAIYEGTTAFENAKTFLYNCLNAFEGVMPNWKETQVVQHTKVTKSGAIVVDLHFD